MLAGLGRSGDTNDLARTTLEHDKITNTDVMGRDCHSARRNTTGTFDEAVALT